MSGCELIYTIVPRWGNSIYSQHHDGVAQPSIPELANQRAPQTQMVSIFTRFEPPDFYLWEFLKNVYENNPQSINELKVAINQKICAIPKQEYVRVIDITSLDESLSLAQ